MNIIRNILVTALCCTALCANAAAIAADTGFLSTLRDYARSTTWEVGTGVDYSTGRYGQASDTSALSVPLTANVQIDRVRLEFALPYLDVKGPGSYVGGIVLPDGGVPMTNSGLGDITLGAAWLAHRDDDTWPAVEIAGNLKIPTASAGLGTGKFDYGASLNLYHALSPQFMLFGSVGYQWLSDFKAIHLENGVLASLGLNFKPTGDTGVGASVSYRQQYFLGFGPQYSASPYAFWNFNDHWRVTGYGSFGFSQASPRIGGGLRLTLFG